MKFLIFAAVVALAAAEYKDDVFNFGTLKKRAAPFPAAFPAYKQAPAYSPFVTKSVDPAFVPFAARPVYAEPAKRVYSPFEARPVFAEAARPVFAESAKRVYSPFEARPVFAEAARPVFAEAARPAFAAVKRVGEPVFGQEYAGAYAGPQWRIVSQVQEADPSGPYRYSYATENGIQVSEQGALIPGAEGPVVAAQGSYSFTAPDGQAYTVNYVADDNGFRPVGDHLPVPPPIPAEIVRSLELNAASAEQYDDQGRLLVSPVPTRFIQKK